ncbi:MAG: amino acid adenylation domain-containing protein [Candidatus Aureabacteria bacterium]|nr:amino acid adenylation domain-containing protein [Candidatus Auribacterota bacterium]
MPRTQDTLAVGSEENSIFTAQEKARGMGLSQGFLRSVKAFGNRPAIEVSDDVLTYEELFEKSASLAATMVRHQTGGEPPLTAVFAYRSATAFAGILAALMRGHGYVPLNRTFPTERTRAMLRRSGCRAMVVDAESEKQLDQILEGMEERMLVVLPERQETRDLAARWPGHRFIGVGELVSHERWRPMDVSFDPIAYLLFTSGSTGVPKGVMVAHRSVRHYIDFMTERFSITCEDRFSQMFDMTFDLSVSDLFVAWERGACVCCPSEKTLINPGKFINEKNITIWFSVPSTAVFMKRLGALKANAYPGLRVSLFCGEALPVEVATAWSAAAPNSVIENLYGPTEVTIACTYYRWDPLRSPSEAAYGVVPIGEPFPGMRPLVVGGALDEVAPGQAGELLMSGPQLSLGYWNDPILTAAAFVKPPGRDETYYRTGDRVRRPAGKGPLLFLGRVDSQVKILGHRVELGEVEAVVREESGIDGVVALGWPRSISGAGGVEVFLQAEGPAQSNMKQQVAARLPFYMVPRRYHFLVPFPLNASGKYDRKALTNRLETLL